MKIHFIEKTILILFLSNGIESVIASNLVCDASENINWWNLGPEYYSKPALGWSYFTFFIFVAITVHYVNKVLKNLLTERSVYIKNKIESMHDLEISTSQELDLVNSKLKSLNNVIRNMTLEFENKSIEQKQYFDSETNLILEKINKNVDTNIQSYINKTQLAIKNELVNNVIIELLRSIDNKPIHYIKDYEDKVIESLSRMRFDEY